MQIIKKGHCNECGIRFDRVISFTERSRSIWVCRECLAAAIKLIDQRDEEENAPLCYPVMTGPDYPWKHVGRGPLGRR